MKGQKYDKDIFPLRFVLFQVGGIRYGVLACQILSSETFLVGSDCDDLVWFHDEAKYPIKPNYVSPVVVVVRCDNDRNFKMIIDLIEGILEVDADDIMSMPSLVERYVIQNGFWGVLSRNGHLYLLTDFCSLIGHYAKPTAAAGD